MTFDPTRSAISSPASAFGLSLFDDPDGPTTDPSGPGPVRASLSARQAKEAGLLTSGTYGQLSTTSSRSAALQSSLASRLPHPSSSESRECKGCGLQKPLGAFRKHNRGGRRWTCRQCENKWVRTTKPWASKAKQAYQRRVRRTRRAMALVSDAKQRAKAKGLPFDLNWKALQARIDAGVCEASGIPFDLNTPKSWNAPSLDQTIPGQGYTMQNTRVVLYAVNTMANEWGLDRVLEIADALRSKK